MEALSGGTASSSPPPTLTAEDQARAVQLLRDHLARACSVVATGGSDATCEPHVLRAFCSEPGALFLERSVVPTAPAAHQNAADAPPPRLYLSPEPHGTTLAVFLKPAQSLDLSRPVCGQVLMLSLGDETTLEGLHAVARLALAPLAREHAAASMSKMRGAAETSAEGLKKSVADFEVALRRCRENAQIEPFEFEVHPEIRDLCPDWKDKKLDVKDLHGVQSCVNGWIKQLQKLSSHNSLREMSRDSNTLQEINFWTELEQELERVMSFFQSPEYECTVHVLREARRIVTLSTLEELSIPTLAEQAKSCKLFVKDFPIKAVLMSSSIKGLQAAMVDAFRHVKDRRRDGYYTARRVVQLMDAVSGDMFERLMSLLRQRSLMQAPLAELSNCMSECNELFKVYNEEHAKLRKHLGVTDRVTHSVTDIWKRITTLRGFREQHEELKYFVERAFPDEPELIAQIAEAYAVVRDCDAIGCSKEQWEAALTEYERLIACVEARVIKTMHASISAARGAQDMFAVLARFNKLFCRPKIKLAVQEYQTPLLSRVRDEIGKLQEKYRNIALSGQANSLRCLSALRDMPSVSGIVLWSITIAKQLEAYEERIKSVLGSGWENQPNGMDLKAEIDRFRQNINPRAIVDKWVQDSQLKSFNINGRLFTVVKGLDGSLKLDVNFDSRAITWMKEVRNLKWMEVDVPLPDVSVAINCKKRFPAVVTLREVLKTYSSALARASQGTAALVANDKSAVEAKLREGASITWDHLSDKYVIDLEAMVTLFSRRVENLAAMCDQASQLVSNLRNCSYTHDDLSGVLDSVQKVIESVGGASNIDRWVAELDSTATSILSARLCEAVSSWTKVLKGEKDNEEQENMPEPERTFSIIVRNQVIVVDPHIEYVREAFSVSLSQTLTTVLSLNRLHVPRTTLSMTSAEPSTYGDLLSQVPTDVVGSAYAAMADSFGLAEQYARSWLKYQGLWDASPKTIAADLGEDLDKWREAMEQLSARRAETGRQPESARFGPVALVARKARSDILGKYDLWHSEIVTDFTSRVVNRGRALLTAIRAAREELERGGTPGDTIAFVVLVQELAAKNKEWSDEARAHRTGCESLYRHRFARPDDWLEPDVIDGEITAFQEILARRQEDLRESLVQTQTRVTAQFKELIARVDELHDSWKKCLKTKMDGNTKYSEALDLISQFDKRTKDTSEQISKLARARTALSLDVSVAPAEEKLRGIATELNDVREVWQSLSGIGLAVDEQREQLFNVVNPRKVRTALEGIIAQIKALPSRVRVYEACTSIERNVSSYLKWNVIVTDLRSEAMRDRHWAVLRRRFGTTALPPDVELTLGHIWDTDVGKNEAIYKEIVLTAQGELGLEEFLRSLTGWGAQARLDLVTYQGGRAFLVRNWDELMTKAAEHAASLMAMKTSPYYKTFAEDASKWEDRLSRAQELLDTWMDVQRRWVYLEGVFSDSAEALLPQEAERFRAVNNEFIGLMRRVQKASLLLEVLEVEGIQKTLTRLSEQLTKIQKALGDFLERQRATFPRFYFIGDEDLLEIIGNAKDVSKAQRHLKKMFAGVSSLVLQEDTNSVVGVSSAQGEELRLQKPVELSPGGKWLTADQWLAKVEVSVRETLATLLIAACDARAAIAVGDDDALCKWATETPAQLGALATQVQWCADVERALSASAPARALEEIVQRIDATLSKLADSVLTDLAPLQRKKYEQLMATLVHQRGVVRSLVAAGVSSANDFEWLRQLRYYLDKSERDPCRALYIKAAHARFPYGWEYLGVPEHIVRTPLVDRAYLALSQALDARLGGSPFGPAGTGKTETVKALGAQFGRFVVVFCCDESFSASSMGRILAGLCRCGAWGCFDEFNRLDERTLSGVSQQIQSIQEAVRRGSHSADLAGARVDVDQGVGCFITMNPTYAGRSNLPDNLKQLFRAVAMSAPDRELIAQVTLYAQGFRTAEHLARKVCPLFELCQEQLSQQPHYDFGLRALKSVLATAGAIRRSQRSAAKAPEPESDEGAKQPSSSGASSEEEIAVIRAVTETVAPKLVPEDISLLRGLVRDVFPGADARPLELAELMSYAKEACQTRHLDATPEWLEKLSQLYQLQLVHHGVMLVGPAGSGKTRVREVLLEAMERLYNAPADAIVIDPKAITKEQLFGSLDPTTREWTDGVFTQALRKALAKAEAAQQAGKAPHRHWIVLDGDVDPEWVETLNSVLDDNKLLTLASGERLSLPPSVRIVFEVQDLKYATLATVSRCGMVWFGDGIVTPAMQAKSFLDSLRSDPLSDPPNLAAQAASADALAPLFVDGGFVSRTFVDAASRPHVMDFTQSRATASLLSLIRRALIGALERTGADLVEPQATARYVVARTVFSVSWAVGGSMGLAEREAFSNRVLAEARASGCCGVLPDVGPTTVPSFLDFGVGFAPDGGPEWYTWSSAVPKREVEPRDVGSPDIVVQTVDTARHADVARMWISERRPVILCGPPGSGKTMTLTSTLSALAGEVDVASLNFSSATTPELVLKTLAHHCEWKRVPATGETVVRPSAGAARWLVVFCDEVNLPSADRYGTQRVVALLRQLVEYGGFWHRGTSGPDRAYTWARLERVQFVAACNPPTDPGRVPLSERFLRHAPVVLVDFPAQESLRQIYGTFCRALCRELPAALRERCSGALSEAMVEWYTRAQKKFTPDAHAHYVFSPRELSRWVRALREAFTSASEPIETLEDLVCVWAHEGIRLFGDRLVEPAERRWVDDLAQELAAKHFWPGEPEAPAHLLGPSARPLLYCDWLSRGYKRCGLEEVREYVRARLRQFYEEELDVPLVVFDEVAEHAVRIDRVLRQPQGHALLVGVSGGGKTVLTRFVAWRAGMSVFSIKVNNKYKAADFDADLRAVMRRAGVQCEPICFVFDESNVLDSSFLERMNTLLAAGDVPGLFEGEEWGPLMHQCRDSASRAGLNLDTEEELYRYFITGVRRNLHVVFTMNPAGGDFHNRAATSPALFNRCVVDWFGEWSPRALFQVGRELTQNLDIDDTNYVLAPAAESGASHLLRPGETLGHREAVVACLVFAHQSIEAANTRLLRVHGRHNYNTPRHYLDLIAHFSRLVTTKRSELEEEQLHLNAGLDRLCNAAEKVGELRVSLEKAKAELHDKERIANDKLGAVVAAQEEAKRKREESIALQQKLAEERKRISERKERADADLSKAEPALIEAQQAVNKIKKSHLDEIRVLGNPPATVRMTMECVTYILSGKKNDWIGIRRMLTETGFIPSVVGFKTDSITDKMRAFVRTNFLADEKFTYDSVNYSSKACGPLFLWVVAQVNYSEIKDRVQPLREEVVALQREADKLQAQADEVAATVAALEQDIARGKDEYASLMREIARLDDEAKAVGRRVDRAAALVAGLGGERASWESQTQSFRDDTRVLVGNCVLAAALLAYGGCFDQGQRAGLLSSWSSFVGKMGVGARADMGPVEFLSTPEERLQWQANSLPADDLCSANAVMLAHFNRYPLVVDPSGQALTFIMKQHGGSSPQKTSAQDPALVKHLESALRFGCSLVVNDAERLDPVLNPVLNREVHKRGGRVLVKLGDNEVDFSPSFKAFLVTRDPTAHFTPDLCSRVTLVNFTVTQSGLLDQCLHHVLSAERPELCKRREQLLRSQGEDRVRLRGLQKSLLAAISQQGGGSSLLDDDKVLATLETLRKDAAAVTERVAESDGIMRQVEQEGAAYRPMALACSKLYFALEHLAQVHFLYQFSLRAFLAMFRRVVTPTNPRLAGVSDQQQRIRVLTDAVFEVVYNRACSALLHEDHATLGLRLAIIRLKGTPDDVSDAEADFLLRAEELPAVQASAAPPAFVPAERWNNLCKLASRSALFAGVPEAVASGSQQWRSFLAAASPEAAGLPAPLDAPQSAVRAAWATLLLLRALRPDRAVAAAQRFVGAVFGDSFRPAVEPDLARAVQDEQHGQQGEGCTPILLCSRLGYDASGRVATLAGTMGRQLVSLAIGAEGFASAEKAVADAARVGSWVLLKNVHLAPAWLSQLEKRLHVLAPNPNFRLFMTSEIHPKLPASLLRQSYVCTYEPPPGLRASLLHVLGTIAPERMERPPHERRRLYFLVAWFHAVTIERLRYHPRGWTKTYEFGESDLRGALDTVDCWVDQCACGADHVPPERLPWAALRALLSQSLYGGRVDNDADARALSSILDRLFVPQSFDEGFRLVECATPTGAAGTDLGHLDVSTHAACLKWAQSLPPETPAWLGLPEDADALLLENEALRVFRRVLRMQNAEGGEEEEEEEEHEAKPEQQQQQGASAAGEMSTAMRVLCQNVQGWLQALPQSFVGALAASESADPLRRCVEREARAASEALSLTRSDLVGILEAAQGRVKHTNRIRSVTADLTVGAVPRLWKGMLGAADCSTPAAFVHDLARRCEHISSLCAAQQKEGSGPASVWLGGLFHPEAYVTATRQAASRANGWSLETLHLVLDSTLATLGSAEAGAVAAGKLRPEQFVVSGMTLENAGLHRGALVATTGAGGSVSLGPMRLRWAQEEQQGGNLVSVPLYLTESRGSLLFGLQIPVDETCDKLHSSVWSERGVALCCWKQPQ
eukprot:m51a1_g6448 putative cytoplasmic dynein 1 heavy chain 1 (4576) ;mRNA; r:416422-430644